MDAPLDILSLWRQLSMREIINSLPPDTFSYREKRYRLNLDEAILALPVDQRDFLDHIALGRMNSVGNENATEDPFMETVSEDVRQDHICKFIDATGNIATAMSACAVCAGSFFNVEIDQVKVTDLHDKNKLQPAKPHPAQKLTDGMLLHVTTSSIHLDIDDCMKANVCTTCTSDLKCDKTPSMSLANGMWIGEVPLELKVLTLPERILVAHFFPAAYIVKLYPKKKGACYWAVNGHHHGLRGNVSTYCLNTNQITHLASSNVMPPSPTVTVTTTVRLT